MNYIKPSGTFVIDYKCPNCKEDAPDFNGEYYTINEKQYPLFLNKRENYNGDLFVISWDEIHCCEKCHVEYYFKNGN